MPRNPLTLLVVILFVVCAAFVFGDFAPLAPFSQLNRHLLQDSLRVVGRFGIGLTLSLALACAVWLGRRGSAQLAPVSCLLLLGALLINLSGFDWMASVSRARELASLPARTTADTGRLRMIELFPPGARLIEGNELRVENTSQMYLAIRRGEGVINCYSALQHPSLRGWAAGGEHRVVDPRFGPVDEACIEESHFTQNHVQLAPSCRGPICLNVGWLNPRDPLPGFRGDPRRRRFCRDTTS